MAAPPGPEQPVIRPGRIFVAITIALGLWAIPLIAAASFELTTFSAFERLRPALGGENGFDIDTSRPGLQVVVSQSCEVRPLSEAKKTFLGQLGVALGQAELFATYTRELNVTERGVSRWIPFQDDTIDHLLSAPCEASEIGITVRYLGAHYEFGKIYAGIGYSRTNLNRPSRTSCFATELLGVAIGTPLEDVRSRLAEKYGQEAAVPGGGERQLWAYPVDDEHETTLIVGDSGSGSRKNVFSVQVWGPPNPDLELSPGLRLGQSASAVQELLGTPVSSKTSSDGFQLLKYEGTPCSVELRDGVLASVMILGDPNYFEE